LRSGRVENDYRIRQFHGAFGLPPCPPYPPCEKVFSSINACRDTLAERSATPPNTSRPVIARSLKPSVSSVRVPLFTIFATGGEHFHPSAGPEVPLC
jgi:hypothetical protein